MTNQHLIQPPDEVVLERLKILLEGLNERYSAGTAVLEADIVSSYHDALNLFFESLDKSILGAMTEMFPGAPANPIAYNIYNSYILKDLQAVFLESGAVDRMLASSFNSLVSEKESVLQTSKRIASKIGDYLLYADPSLGAGYFFGDSFNTLDRIDSASPLLGGDECFVSTEEGVVLLPLNGEPTRPKVASIIINSSSNGEAGNNYQQDASGHSELAIIGDGQPNTWFEYEKISAYESNTPLILDLTIALEGVNVINHININPINFGTPTPVRISVIETSRDGLEYTSIKDEIPLKDFISEDEDNVFSLSPATNKYAGQGFFSFLPRKVQFVHIVLEQHTPYYVETINGPRLRYAIGLRDINIFSRKFKEEGSLVSSLFNVEGNLRKVSLWASENPAEKSTLADITHSISYDDGASWLDIQPQGRDAYVAPEIINFNTIADGAVETSDEVTSLRHKIKMKRNAKEFSGDITIKQEKIQTTEVTTLPIGGEAKLTLTNEPIKDTVSVILPFAGSFGCPTPRYGDYVFGKSVTMDLDAVEFSVDAPAMDTIRYRLPYKGIKNLPYKIRVSVNGELWEYCAKDPTAFTSPYISDLNLDVDSESPTYQQVYGGSKVYFLNRDGLELQFGHVDSLGIRRGMIPSTGAKIKVYLDGDNPSLEISDEGYILNLTTPSDGIKTSVSILALEHLSEDEAEEVSFNLPHGSLTFRKIDSFGIDPTRKQIYRDGELWSSELDLDSTKNIALAISRKSGNRTLSKRDDKISTTRGSASERSTSFLGGINKYLKGGTYYNQGYDGMLPPIFLEGIDNFEIKEYSLTTGNLLTGAERVFTDKVEFIDGETELRDSTTWEKVPSRYTFDSYTGSVYLGSSPAITNKTMFFCKRTKAKIISEDGWEFKKDSTGKIDTQKIVLDPRVVYTAKQITSYTRTEGVSERSIILVTGNDPNHSWFNKFIVKGTVKPDTSLFASSARPIEVTFFDGISEFSNFVSVADEQVTLSTSGNLHTFVLQQISSIHTLSGSPSFYPIRSENSSVSPANAFITEVANDVIPSSEGEWNVVTSGGVSTVTLYSESVPGEHYVSYTYSVTDPGVDISGLYSIDYYNGIIYFANDIENSGNISYEVSVYSVFYNIGEVVSEGDIEEISEENKTVKFGTAFQMRLLKQDTATKSRPQYAKVSYEYYKRSTESLKDLEPYFSPICRDVAFRSVTSDFLEEL